MTRLVGIACLCLGLLAGIARAAESQATDELLAQLDRITHLQGDFTQRQFGEGEAVLVESSGSFRLLRPVFFSWEIRAPDRQLIVANEEFLWHYDIDLQTATRRPVVGNVDASPLQILGGDASALRERYTITRDAPDVFTLVPLDSAHSFRRLTVAFADDTITRMDIVDKLGQRLVVDLQNVDSTTALDATDFEFTPPPEGVDLFYYDD